MKLLFITQKVDMNDDVLGFTHDWLLEFSKICQRLTVIALSVGEHDLPDNVKILSLGKEAGRSKIKYLINFYKYIWRERLNYDTVLVHMNKEYVVLGGWFWRLTGKKIALWYVHKQTSLMLKLAEKIVDVIFTASKESFKLLSRKLKIVGHGVDLNKFYYRPEAKRRENFKIIYVGRISRIKNQRLLIEAMNILNKRGAGNIKIDLVGSPVYPEDEDYKNELAKLIGDYRLKNQIKFTGSVPNREIAQIYRQADLSVNLCPTGGMDKAVLEAMAVGLPVIAFNKTFAPLLNGCKNLILNDLSAIELAQKIYALVKAPQEELNLISFNLRKKIIGNYGLAALTGKIINELKDK